MRTPRSFHIQSSPTSPCPRNRQATPQHEGGGVPPDWGDMMHSGERSSESTTRVIGMLNIAHKTRRAAFERRVGFN